MHHDRPAAWLVLGALAVAVGLVALTAICLGSSGIGPKRSLETLTGLRSSEDAQHVRDMLIINQIRLPRLLLGLCVGAALAVAGAIMQGLFRNPLADPGLIGVSSGASFAAAATIVFGDRIAATGSSALPFVALPAAAFFGSLVATIILYVIASRDGRTSIAVMLLAGVSMGSLGGATWTKFEVAAPMILPTLLAAPFVARGLNALALGDSEAFHLGINVERLKAASVMLVSISVGAAVACSGLIGFVGIIVPHFLRLVIGPDYRVLLPASALLGAALLVTSDICARTLVAPSELPIGIVTATVGGPFFLWLLLSRRRDFGL